MTGFAMTGRFGPDPVCLDTCMNNYAEYWTMVNSSKRSAKF